MQFSPNIPCYFCTCRDFKLQMEFCAIFCRRMIRDRAAGNRNELFVVCMQYIADLTKMCLDRCANAASLRFTV